MKNLPKRINIVITPQMARRRLFGSPRNCPLARVVQLATKSDDVTAYISEVYVEGEEYRLEKDFNYSDYSVVFYTGKPFKTKAIRQ